MSDFAAVQERTLAFWLERLDIDLATLPEAAAQIVGGWLQLEPNFPNWLKCYVVMQLARRVDMTVVSPAARAVMSLRACAPYRHSALAEAEIDRQCAFLRLTGMENKVVVASNFMRRLGEQLVVLAQDLREQPEASIADAE